MSLKCVRSTRHPCTNTVCLCQRPTAARSIEGREVVGLHQVYLARAGVLAPRVIDSDHYHQRNERLAQSH